MVKCPLYYVALPRVEWLRWRDLLVFFVLPPNKAQQAHYYFVATGTGVSPFHSIIRSFGQLRYTLLYGIHNCAEAADIAHYKPERLVLCTSRSADGDFSGRVTTYIREKSVTTDSVFYLCGGSQMIADVTDLLVNKGVPPENIRTEAFY